MFNKRKLVLTKFLGESKKVTEVVKRNEDTFKLEDRQLFGVSMRRSTRMQLGENTFGRPDRNWSDHIKDVTHSAGNQRRCTRLREPQRPEYPAEGERPF